MMRIKNEKTDKVAILLATYNGEEYLREQLDSLLSQTYHNWITFIHDDGSTDRTRQIIDEYVNKYPNKFVYLEGEPTGGAKRNFYYLLKSIEAPIYLFCDQDDVWLEKKVEHTIERLQINKGVPILVFSDLIIVDDKLNVIAESMWKYYKFDVNQITVNSLLLRNIVTGCTMAINRELREYMIKYQNIDDTPMHDKWAALIAAKFGIILKNNMADIMYRQHQNNVVGAVNSHKLSFWIRKIRKYKQLKLNYEYTRRQAQEMVRVFNLDENDPINIYANIMKSNRIIRMYKYYKYGFRTNSISQRIGLFIAG